MKNLLIAGLLFLLPNLVFAQQKNAQVQKLYHNYIAIKDALAADNADNASKAADDFIRTASAIDYKVLTEGNVETLRADATIIAEARSIATQRKAFHKLSNNMIALSKEFKLADNKVYLQYCPMAKGSWLSDESKIMNPYHGSNMLACGNVKSVIE